MHDMVYPDKMVKSLNEHGLYCIIQFDIVNTYTCSYYNGLEIYLKHVYML